MTDTAEAPGARWLTVSDGTAAGPGADPPLRWGRLVGGVALVAVLVFAAVAVAGVVTARRAAEREAVNDAATITDVLAGAVLQPALTDDLLSADPVTAAAARTALGTVVRQRLLSRTLIRVKLWSADGRIVYSDEPALAGAVFPLDDEERDALAHPTTRAEVSDLGRPENRFERTRFGSDAKLLEVYRPVWTPGGTELLFETYSRYDAVTARTTQLWRGFGGITLTSLLLLLVAQAPLTWALIARVRSAQAGREAWLQRAVTAQEEERRRIAATLHDGTVQELAATGFLVAGSAEQARAGGDDGLAHRLDLAAGAVRSSIGGLRSLLVDIYPPSLRSAGLVAALRDLAAAVAGRDVQARLDLPEADAPGLTGLAPDVEALAFRVAQEALRNAARHAGAGTVDVRLAVPDDGPLVLEIADDGVGFDAAATLAEPPAGHFGLRLMADLAGAAGATLKVASAPGAGTRWRLEVPR
ncbi:sensor histidine kinase [Spongisporangium articulatum]|uniref:Sensor histidine kinase n=1 Tax=Spongisporangium articulatum TaxID=3362603 RepID=A0ABW8AMG5_9ACTN